MNELAPHPRDSELKPVRRKPDGAYGHEGEPWDDLARLGLEPGFAMTIREWRESMQCRECGHDGGDVETFTDDNLTVPCKHGCCVSWRCVECNHSFSGAGPAGCECGCED